MESENRNPKVDAYLNNLPNWSKEITLLRSIMLTCDVKEEWKWSKACYTYAGKNIAVIQGFKSYCALLFMKGVLLKDTEKVLVKTGANTEVGRQLRFMNPEDVTKLTAVIKSYVAEAISIEKAGIKLPPRQKKEIPLPLEFEDALAKDAALKKAFENLTPGRQKAYLRYFSEAKQSKTRLARIEKVQPKILAGKGLTD